MSQPIQTPKSRVDWVDYAKGITIIFVVLRHVIGGLIEAEFITNSWLLYLYNGYSVNAFSMPLAFVVAGLFIERSAKKPLSQFTLDRVRNFVYPYFLWSLITYEIALLLGKYTNGQVISSSSEILYRLFVDPNNRFWFLYDLFLMVMFFAIARKLRVPRWGFLAGAVGVFVLGRVLHFENPTETWNTFTFFIVFFALGMFFSPQILQLSETLTLRQVQWGAVLSMSGWGVYILLPLSPENTWVMWIQPVILMIATIGGLLIAVWLSRAGVFRHMQFWGRHSLEIYVAHGLAVSGVRIIMSNFLGIENALIHLVVGTLAGVYFPLMLWWTAKQINFNYVYTLPTPKPAAGKNPPLAKPTLP